MASGEMFGFGVIFAIMMAMSLGLILCIKSPRQLYTRARSDFKTFLIQNIVLVWAVGMASIIIYGKLWLELAPFVFKKLAKLGFFDDDIDLAEVLDQVFDEILVKITDAIDDFCAPKWALYSVQFHRLAHIWECTEADLDELAYCLVFPVVGSFSLGFFIGQKLGSPGGKKLLRFARWLFVCAKAKTVSAFSSTVAAGKAAYVYARDTHVVVKLTAENTDLKSKKERLESAHAEALLREANAIVLAALFGKSLKISGDKILSLEATSKILESACDIWFQESEQLKKGAVKCPAAAHDHQMNLIQGTINQLSMRTRVLQHSMNSEKEQRQSLEGQLRKLRKSADRERELRAKMEGDVSNRSAHHKTQLKDKEDEIKRLKEQIRQRNNYELELEGELAKQKLATKHERLMRNCDRNDAHEAKLAKQNDHATIKELQKKLRQSQITVVEHPAAPKVSVRETELEAEVGRLRTSIESYRRQEKEALVIQTVPPQNDTDKQMSQELLDLKHDKKLLQDRVRKSEEEGNNAKEQTKELQSKVDELVAASSKRAENDLTAKSSALEEKTQEHNELLHVHSQCPNQQQLQDLIAQKNASEEREAALQTELQRLCNIEKEKSLIQQKENETAGKLKQAEITIATQQTLLQNQNSNQSAETTGSSNAAVQKLNEANNRIALLQGEVKRLTNIEQEKLAADARASQAMQQLQQQQANAVTSGQVQQAQAKYDEQQNNLLRAVQRIEELESQPQVPDERVNVLQAQVKTNEDKHKHDLDEWTKLKSALEKDKAEDKGSIRRLNEDLEQTRSEAKQEIEKRDSQIKRLQMNSNITTSHQQDRDELRRVNVKYAQCLKKSNQLEAALDEPCMECSTWEYEYQQLQMEKERLEEENEEMAEELDVADEDFEVDYQVGQMNFSELREKCMDLKVDKKALEHKIENWKEQYQRQEEAFQREQSANGAKVRTLENQLTSAEDALDDQLKTTTALERQLALLDPEHPPIVSGSSDDDEAEGDEESEEEDSSIPDDMVDYEGEY